VLHKWGKTIKMDSKKVDGRITRTLTQIREAFVALLVEQGFEAVTVQAVTQRAGINRATFYRHYTDKYDLADRLVNGLFDEVLSEVNPSALPNVEPSTAVWQILFLHVQQYQDFYRVMLGPGGIPGFPERVRQEVETQMVQLIHNAGVNEAQLRMPLSLAVRYMAAAQVGLIQWWLENDMPYSPQEAADFLLKLHRYGGTWALSTEDGG
jgi:AcrR family transcriptional regulator